jgi:acylphosphatase
MTTNSIHGTVSGRVQGVGFRFYVSKAATSLGINGWVRNTSNGEVEFEAEGDLPSLEGFLAAIRRGSPWSVVTELQVHPQPLKNYTSFTIED